MSCHFISPSPPNYELPLSFWLITSSMPFSPLNYSICLEYQLHLPIMSHHFSNYLLSSQQFNSPSPHRFDSWLLHYRMILWKMFINITSHPDWYTSPHHCPIVLRKDLKESTGEIFPNVYIKGKYWRKFSQWKPKRKVLEKFFAKVKYKGKYWRNLVPR